MITTLYYCFYQLGFDNLVKTIYFDEINPALKDKIHMAMMQQAEIVIQKTQYSDGEIQISIIKQRYRDHFDLITFNKLVFVYNTILKHHENIPDVSVIVKENTTFDDFLYNYKHLKETNNVQIN